jgi:hypothetical protein
MSGRAKPSFTEHRLSDLRHVLRRSVELAGQSGRSADARDRLYDDVCTTGFGQNTTFSANKNDDQRINEGRRSETC